MRYIYLALGFFFVAVGFIGAFLPVLPTTPFLILAAACFARSSRQLENWLLGHPRFGVMLRAWREHGAIPWRVKLMALAGTSLGFVLLLIGRPGALALAGAGALMLAGLAYVFTRPSL